MDREARQDTEVAWPESADEIFASDQTVALAQTTPARGVTLAPVTNFGVRDRDAATMAALNTSIGLWKKLPALKERPDVAVAYHTREHGFTTRSEYVLVQGTASLGALEDRDWIDRHLRDWERLAGPRDVGPIWEWWLRYYHWRVPIEIAVRRVTVWPDLACRGAPRIYGEPPADPPPAQRPPRRGKAPRLNQVRAAKLAARLPYVLLGWVGGDGLPVAIPAEVAGAQRDGVILKAASGLVPPGARRAALVAHAFTRHGYGQNQRKYTGWLEVDESGTRLLYAPHTKRGYYLPSFAFRLAAGAATRLGYYRARRSGLLVGV
jgi:hypothetical protein